jgi:SPX domain protein involved in polyphosphate accumulation
MVNFIHSCQELYMWRDRLARLIPFWILDLRFWIRNDLLRLGCVNPCIRNITQQQILSSDRGSGRAVNLLSSSALQT